MKNSERGCNPKAGLLPVVRIGKRHFYKDDRHKEYRPVRMFASLQEHSPKLTFSEVEEHKLEVIPLDEKERNRVLTYLMPFERTSFEDFLASKVQIHATTCAEILQVPLDTFKGTQTLLYKGFVYIELLEDNTYYLMIDRQEFEEVGEAGLKKLERKLYEFALEWEYI